MTDIKHKVKKKASNVVGNAQAELGYASKKGQTTKLREGSKLLSVGGKALKTAGALGRGISGAALIAGGIQTVVSLTNSLRRGEGFAKLLQIGKKK